MPPVASKSSTIAILEPFSIASLCISNISVPYSRSYSFWITSLGNLPFFLIGINPTPRAYATALPIKNPLASGPTT